jgi:DNA-binding MarR family transcriptional regulator
MKYLLNMTDRHLLKIQADRLFTAVEEIEKSLVRDLAGAELDLTKPQLRTLIAISRVKCCTMSELGKLTGYPSSALTGIIDRMLKKRLVKRVRDDDDRRIVKVMATDTGSNLATGFQRKLMRSTSVILEKMGPTDREKMVSLIEKIAAGFTEQGNRNNG